MTGVLAPARANGPRLLTAERVRNYSLIVAVGAAIALAIAVAFGHYPLVLGGQPFLPDFLARWTGGRLLVSGQVTGLFDAHVQAALQHAELPGYRALSWFVSPPFVAALYAPLGLLPYGWSAAVWMVVNLGLLTAALLLVRPLLGEALAGRRRLFVLAFLATPAVFEVLGSGQDSLVLLVLWLATIRLLLADRPMAAGTVCALLLIKPQMVILVPVLLVTRRQWRTLAGFLTMSAVLAAASLALVGVGGISRWLVALSSPLYAQQVQHGQAWKMQSVAALATALTGSDLLGFLVFAAGATLLVFTLARTTSDTGRDWAVLALVTAACSPHLMLYDLVLLLPTAAVVFSQEVSPAIRWAVALTAVLGWTTAARHALAAVLGPAGPVIDAPWAAIPLAVLTWLVIRNWMSTTRLEPTR